MKKIKNYIIICTLSIIWFVWFLWICEWQWTYYSQRELESDFPFDGEKTVDAIACDENTDLWTCISIKEDEKKDANDTIIRRLLWVFGLHDEKNNDPKFIDYAKAIVNMALWLVAFIALIMAIYTFYMMLFSENEAGIKKAKWNLFGIFIALVIIWLAWLIISFIFRWYQSNWKAHEAEIETWKIENVWEFYD